MQYTYEALASGQIRILELSPGSNSEPLRGQLKIADIREWTDTTKDNRRAFEALSYCWGESSGRHHISLGSGLLDITDSLYSFLTRLRHPIEARHLWADAICINQLDNTEKEEQVQMMAKIYSAARRVLADLGDSTEDSDTALDLIDRYWRKFICYGGNKFVFGKWLTPEETAIMLGIQSEDVDMSWKNHKLPPWDAPQWVSVANLLDRAWFSRLWIVQEFILAKDVLLYCGLRTLQWGHLYALRCKFGKDAMLDYAVHSQQGSITVYHSLQRYACMAAQRAFRLRKALPEALKLHEIVSMQTRKFEATKLSLAETIYYYRHSKSAFERDRYYALMGITEDRDRVDAPELRPDYSNGDREVSLRIAKYLLQRDDGRDHLILAGLRTEDPEDVPSWMLSIKLRPENDTTLPLAWSMKKSHAAGAGSNFIVESVNDWPDVISLKGSKVDEVLEVSQDIGASAFPVSRMDELDTHVHVLAHLLLLTQLFFRHVPEPEDASRKLGLAINQQYLEAIVRTIISINSDWAHPRDIGILALGFTSALAYSLHAEAQETETQDEDAVEADSQDWLDTLARILESAYGWDDVLACVKEEANRPLSESILRKKFVEDSAPLADSSSDFYDGKDAVNDPSRQTTAEVITSEAKPDEIAMGPSRPSNINPDIVESARHEFIYLVQESLNAGVKGAVTSETKFAGVPSFTKPGDELWIISGCRYPVILRKSAARPGMYRFLGVCYANGFMDGETVLREGFEYKDILMH